MLVSAALPQNFSPPAIPVARPRLPSAERILPYLREIDSNGWYTNHGPLWLRFHTRLAQHWGLHTSQLALACNATAGLSLALQASQVEPGRECLLPSWTFVATAGAVRQAGLVPHFVDVQAGNWAPDPAAVQAIALRRKVGAIVVVAPFGAPLDLAAWDAVAEATGVPVIIDAAAAFDTMRRDGPMPLGRCAAVISLHATKVFGIGEGGVLLSRDAAMVERFRRLTNFGFLGSRESVLAGVNAKISEYGAAIGLAALDVWGETRARWATVTRTYLRRLRAVPDIWPMPGLGLDWVASTLNIVWPADRLDQAAGLAEHGVGTLRWWGPGCHQQPGFAECAAEPLPVTEELGRRTLALPFWQDMQPTQIEAVCRAIAICCPPVATRARRRKATLLPA